MFIERQKSIEYNLSKKNVKKSSGMKTKVRNNRGLKQLPTKTARKPAPRATIIPPIPARRRPMSRVPTRPLRSPVSMFDNASDYSDECDDFEESEEEVTHRGPCPECGALKKCFEGCRYGKNKNNKNECHNCDHLQCLAYFYLSWETDSPYLSHVSSSDVSFICLYRAGCKHFNMDSNGKCHDCDCYPSDNNGNNDANNNNNNNSNGNLSMAIDLTNENLNNNIKNYDNSNEHNHNNSSQKPLPTQRKHKSILHGCDVSKITTKSGNTNKNTNNINNKVLPQPNAIGFKTTDAGVFDDSVDDDDVSSVDTDDLELSDHLSDMAYPDVFVECARCDGHQVCKYACELTQDKDKCSRCESRIECINRHHQFSIYILSL